jgi:sugar O-acyltransferase (sialic acid O-acetyltransferase NeuD family)
MKKLIILGAGGMGREVYNSAKESIGYNQTFIIKGFLDINNDILNGFYNYPPVLGNENDYEIQEDDVFVSSIGDLEIRKKSAEIIKKKGGAFISLISNNAIVHSNTKIGNGCILQSNTIIGADVEIGENCLIQYNVTIGHDVKVGYNTRIDSNAVLVGGVIVEDSVMIHTSAVINHKVILHSNSVVGACSFVIRSVKSGTTVFGNPAILL